MRDSKLCKEALSKDKNAAIGVPIIMDYGLMKLENMHESDLESIKSIGEPQTSSSSRLFGYYIIP